MAVAQHIPPQEDVINLDILQLLTNIIYGAQSFAKMILGFAGLVIVSVFLILLLPIVHILLFRLNNKLELEFKKIYNWINTANERELMEFHLLIEKKNKQNSFILAKAKVIDKNPVTMGISSRISMISKKIIDLEKSLKRASYPNLTNPLSDKDFEELENSFKNTDDWRDSRLDVYESYL